MYEQAKRALGISRQHWDTSFTACSTFNAFSGFDSGRGRQLSVMPCTVQNVYCENLASPRNESSLLCHPEKGDPVQQPWKWSKEITVCVCLWCCAALTDCQEDKTGVLTRSLGRPPLIFELLLVALWQAALITLYFVLMAEISCTLCLSCCFVCLHALSLS